jgi:transposase-like protein
MAITMERKKGGRPSSLKRPRSEEELRELVELYRTHTSTELAEIYNVKPTTIRTWVCNLRKGQY